MYHSSVKTIKKGFKHLISDRGITLVGIYMAFFAVVGFFYTVLPEIVFFSLYTVFVPGIIALSVISIRSFLSDSEEHIPEDAYKEDLWTRVAKIIVYSIGIMLVAAPAMLLWAATWFLVFLGPLAIFLAVLLNIVVIGFWIYVWLGLFLVTYIISYEDKGLIESVKYSWSVAKDNRWYLAKTWVLVSLITSFVGGGISSVVGFIPGIGMVLSFAISGAATVVGLAMFAVTYTVIKDGHNESKNKKEEKNI